MYTIETLNSISPKGLDLLPSHLFRVEDEADAPDGILVRSANMQEATFGESLLAIARAGAGTNNIPVDRCTEQGIVVFNTPGANANAVKELVLGGMVLASRKVAAGIAWATTLEGEDGIPKLVEKGKSQFVGPELAGKTLGVIGLGAIGVKVANMATHLGMEVLGYDPFISIDAAWSLSRSVKRCVSLSDIVADSDYLTLHLPVNDETRGFIGKESLTQMKHGVRILNFARGELVNDDDMLKALKNGRVAAYVTDFPNEKLLGQPGVICIPHLGASTPESEENCAMMAAEEMKDYLLNGNILNSVNLPAMQVPRTEGSRVCVIHFNKKGRLANLTAVFDQHGLNIANLTNKSRGDVAYTMMDVDEAVSEVIAGELAGIEDVIRVRVL